MVFQNMKVVRHCFYGKLLGIIQRCFCCDKFSIAVLSEFCFQAVFASVLPGEIMRGSIGQMIQFPSWLGKNSTTTKNDRLLQELCQHMRLQYVIVHLRYSTLTENNTAN